jgi:hypothetical protein
MLTRSLPAPKPLLEIIDGAFAAWLGDGDFSRWRAFCAALRAEPMSQAELDLYRQCTGRTNPPQKPFTEAFAVVGRRGGKSRIAAALACYFACHVQWPRTPGETLRVLVVALSKDQAALTLGYAEALLRSRPALARLIRSVGSDTIDLVSGIQVTCVANNFRSIRGPTVIAAIFEELAYWYDENSANPDKEVLRAVKPSMLTVPGSVLLGISSPYAKRGLLYEKHRVHHGRDDSRVLVWQAPTETMNPRVDPAIIELEYAEDPTGAAAEYGAQFRDDIAQFVNPDTVWACVERGMIDRSPVAGVQYVGFADPAGGSGGDSMTLAVAHKNSDCVILDRVLEFRPPFAPSEVVAQCAAVLKTYRVHRIRADRYAGDWPTEAFSKHGITCEPADRSKSDIYRDFLPLITSKRALLLDDQRMIAQLCSLERRVARGGKDSIDHPRHASAHDDLINSAAGAMVALGGASNYTAAMMAAVGTRTAWPTRYFLNPHLRP